MTVQQNAYLGRTPRPFLRMTLSDLAGTAHDLMLLADTGSPYALILKEFWFDRLVHTDTKDIDTNFGRMASGWVHLYMPDFGISELVKAYSNRSVGRDLAAEHPDFAGLVGLPVLRLGEYGGNATDFWFRYPPPTPIAL